MQEKEVEERFLKYFELFILSLVIIVLNIVLFLFKVTFIKKIYFFPLFSKLPNKKKQTSFLFYLKLLKYILINHLIFISLLISSFLSSLTLPN